MSIGYACLAIGVPGSEMKSCIQSNATQENLLSLIENNLKALENIIEYNVKNDIRLFRISSDLIPFGSSKAIDIPWPQLFSSRLERIGTIIRDSGMRVSMHPGQYTVLNSPDPDVVTRAIQDLIYHTTVLTGLGLDDRHKIVLHIGGAYGDKEQAMRRFITVYDQLDNSVKRRLILENDDRMYTISEVLFVAGEVGAPVVFDTLHHAVNPPDEEKDVVDWIRACAKTWRVNDGPPKIHYSQQNAGKRSGAHTDTIAINTFLEFFQSINDLPVDIMLEVKDKNVSAIKCINCIEDRGIRALEEEWGRYKYLILEKSPTTYEAIRKLLKDKQTYPVREMYTMIEFALKHPFHAGHAENAAGHVWGYFKNIAADSEKRRYQNHLLEMHTDPAKLSSVKKTLRSLAEKYEQTYLLNGYYFYF